MCLQLGAIPARPSQREAGGDFLRTPQHSSQGGLAGHPQLAPTGAGGAHKEGTLARVSAPLAGWGGGGDEEGADGSNYGSDPPPPVARGRKIGSVRYGGRRGDGLCGPQSSGVGSASPGGDFLPLGTGLGDSLRKGQHPPPPPLPAPASAPRVVSGLCPNKLRACRSPSSEDFQVGPVVQAGELYRSAGCYLNRGRAEGMNGV